MSIRLDWEIDTQQTSILNAGEDPDGARRRRRARFHLLLTVAFVLLIITVVGGYLWWRLYTINLTIENSLRNVVSSEVTALRLGDWTAFSNMQRSADPDWLPMQRELFDSYTDLIQRSADVQLTGRILQLEIDDARARVHVEEIVDGVPYERVWFYWRYEEDYDDDDMVDDWLHVPPDYTFWGDTKTYTQGQVNIDYKAVDEPIAIMVGNRLNEWIMVGCDILECETVPVMNIEIIPNGLTDIEWPGNSWNIRMPSPYAGQARSDLPFTPDDQIKVATSLAERLVDQVSGQVLPVYPADAYYIRQAVISWLVGQFILIDTNSFMIDSLVQQYDPATISNLLRAMQPDANISILSDVTGLPLEQLNIDWRDFFTWRLSLESELIIRQSVNDVMMLYDVVDDAVKAIVPSQMTEVQPTQSVVFLVQPTAPSAEGLPQILVTAQVSSDEMMQEINIVFRLRDNRWLRAS